MGKAAKIVVDELIDAMVARPDTFRCGEYTLDDKRSGMQFWIASGRLSCGVYAPYRLQFGPWQSLRFHRALRAWKAWDATRRLRLACAATGA